MATRNDTSSSTILLALILIITFPVWIVVAGALFGVAVGLVGVAVGVIGAIFGVMIGLIALPFKILFGWGHWGWGWHWFPFHHNGFALIAIIIVAALIVRGRKQAS